ncbi:unnamed protein product [Danaus chrysippus]|uniref:(African queen) hypothetical protein n=1 Tax=Danaus chrysippus TaxID=151541 RepID=A0A8J2QHK6_9NEOP|nr:unnamed protein product [Danaus chrysippus]
MFLTCKEIYSVKNVNLYIYNSSVSVYVTELLSNDRKDFDEIFCVCSRGSGNGLGLGLEFCGERSGGGGGTETHTVLQTSGQRAPLYSRVGPFDYTRKILPLPLPLRCPQNSRPRP